MSRREAVLFLEKQKLRQWHVRILLAFPPAALLFIDCRQMLWHIPWGSPPPSNAGLIFLTVLLIGVYIRLITVNFVTELRSDELLIGLHGFWKRRRIPPAQIQSAAPVNYDAAADFGGYGIRSGRRGKAYIAQGNRAVELVLTNGERILIGSQAAEELTRKILGQRNQNGSVESK